MRLLDARPFQPSCRACPRLAAYLDGLRRSYPEYHNSPVAAWGRPDARLLIVGLAPGLHGANRPGRPFVGDASGVTLFGALEAAELAHRARNGGVVLRGARITNAVRCVPPQNRPTSDELDRCRGFLSSELEALCPNRARRNRCVVALGRLAFDSVRKALGMRGHFAHGASFDVTQRLRLLATYHPSRLNTNTGRLTLAMLTEVFCTARAFLEET